MPVDVTNCYVLGRHSKGCQIIQNMTLSFTDTGPNQSFLTECFIDRNSTTFTSLNWPFCLLIPIELQSDRVQARGQLNAGGRELSRGVPIHQDLCALWDAIHLRPGDARGRLFVQHRAELRLDIVL